MNNSDDAIGPFGRSFIGDFPTLGSMLLLLSTFFLSALFSLGNLIPFLILFIISSLSVVYISYSFIEPHFNERLYISKKKSLPKILEGDTNLSMSEIGNLLYARSDDKSHRWDFSYPDWFQSSNHKNTGASNKLWLSWLIIITFWLIYSLLNLIILPLIFLLPAYLLFDVSITITCRREPPVEDACFNVFWTFSNITRAREHAWSGSFVWSHGLLHDNSEFYSPEAQHL